MQNWICSFENLEIDPSYRREPQLFGAVVRDEAERAEAQNDERQLVDVDNPDAAAAAVVEGEPEAEVGVADAEDGALSGFLPVPQRFRPLQKVGQAPIEDCRVTNELAAVQVGVHRRGQVRVLS